MHQYTRRLGVRITDKQWQKLVKLTDGLELTPSTLIRACIDRNDVIEQVISSLQKQEQ